MDISTAANINKIAKIQAAGNVVFRVTKSLPSNVITWKATRYYIDETSNAVTYATDTTTLTGDTAKINLAKTTGKYTYYKVFAFEAGKADSVIVLVLISGVVQKYLYTNTAYSQYSVPVWVVLPTNYSASSKFIMTMCGINRDASTIVTYWVPFANANNYIAAAPEFGTTNWSSDAYILGNMFTGSSGTGSLNPSAKWSFNIVEKIHQELDSLCGLSDSTYELWGHSAGGQFVHRLAFFLPDPLIKRYIAGNSGWYTCPDLSTAFPWGAQNSQLNLTKTDLTAFSNRNLIIMRGTADTVRDAALNTDPLSDAQGLNRYTRAAYFYNSGKTANANLKWKMIDVAGVGHDDQKMALAGGNYILANPTGIKDYNNFHVEKFSVSNYPNPFNPSTKIIVAIPKSSRVNITIFDVLGRPIRCLADDYLTAGNYRYEFNAANLVSGVYLCRVTGEDFKSTLKLQLLK